MGNCLILQDKKVIRVIRTDGKTLSYPLKLHQILSNSEGHEISNTKLSVCQHLNASVDKRVRPLHHHLPAKNPVTTVGAVRIKLVLSKRELKNMINNGEISIGSVIPHLSVEASNDVKTNEKQGNFRWCPSLESILEVE